MQILLDSHIMPLPYGSVAQRNSRLCARDLLDILLRKEYRQRILNPPSGNTEDSHLLIRDALRVCINPQFVDGIQISFHLSLSRPRTLVKQSQCFLISFGRSENKIPDLFPSKRTRYAYPEQRAALGLPRIDSTLVLASGSPSWANNCILHSLRRFCSMSFLRSEIFDRFSSIDMCNFLDFSRAFR